MSKPGRHELKDGAWTSPFLRAPPRSTTPPRPCATTPDSVVSWQPKLWIDEPSVVWQEPGKVVRKVAVGAADEQRKVLHYCGLDFHDPVRVFLERVPRPLEHR